ncbi:MAG: RNA 3'-phosphate cyclase [Phycisphaerae bacterium]|nr:RNA 3'-phosphate cyclase [Phycisphaerae bacterium]
MIEIDGSQGEGGGQIVRTALTLAACLGKAVTIRKIRDNRAVSGLRPQHLTAVRAIGQICGARIGEPQVGQTKIEFHPGPVKAGAYTFEVGTAGSTTLVLQTIALPLMLAEGPSIIKVTGGTHNPKAPCFEYLAHAWVPLLRMLKMNLGIGLARAGFYPHGGGTIVAQIDGGVRPDALEPIELMERGELKAFRGIVKLAGHPMNIGYRARKAALHQLERRGIAAPGANIEIELIEALDAAACCVLWVEFEHTFSSAVGVSSKGKTPEGAASDAVGELADFLAPEKGGQTALDPHAADQLMLPLVMVPGTSRYTTSKVTEHCLTNASVIEQITGRSVRIEGNKDEPGTITVT